MLIDGYRRVGALRRLGRDTVGVEQWSCDLTTALLRLLARTRDRAFASIEEALLLRALVAEHGLPRHEVARRSGRDVSWVSRRLQLLSGLPDAALAAVRGGHLSSWVANRVIVLHWRAPTPRMPSGCWYAGRDAAVNAGVAVLVRALPADPGGPRASTWSTARACSSTRCRRIRRGTPARACVPAPEGECIGDLRCLEAVIARLRKRVATLRPLPAPLIAAAPRLRTAIDALTRELEREDTHDPDRDPRRGARPASAGARPARDQPPAGDVAQYGAADPA